LDKQLFLNPILTARMLFVTKPII